MSKLSVAIGPAYQYKAKLVRVVDGDTIWLDVDLGFKVRIVMDFRLAGINAPEMSGVDAAKGIAAKEFLTMLLADKEIVVTSTKTEKFGRWLGVVSVKNGDAWTSVNQTMIDTGHAVSFM